MDTETSNSVSEATHSIDDTRSLPSDESSFYGDHATKKEYEQLAQDIDTAECWRVHEWNMEVIAARAVRKNPSKWSSTHSKRKRETTPDGPQAANKKIKVDESERPQNADLTLRPLPTKRHNPYEGNSYAMQLDESVDSFLQRLKPSSPIKDIPWIWCANFESGHHHGYSNVAVFKQVGTRLLERFLAKQQDLENSCGPTKPPSVITRILGPERKVLKEDIIREAKKHGVMTGKWMLFPTIHKVDQYWSVVVRGTANGRLGIAAKVATRSDNLVNPSQVICIYTRDITDEADIKRVLLELVRLKLAAPTIGPTRGSDSSVRSQIWYKPDCYTCLEINSGNQYKIKPTLYGTCSLLTAVDLRGLG